MMQKTRLSKRFPMRRPSLRRNHLRVKCYKNNFILKGCTTKKDSIVRASMANRRPSLCRCHLILNGYYQKIIRYRFCRSINMQSSVKREGVGSFCVLLRKVCGQAQNMFAKTDSYAMRQVQAVNRHRIIAS